MTQVTKDQIRDAEDALELIKRYSTYSERVQDRMQPEFDAAVETIRAALSPKPSGGDADLEHELYCLKANFKHLEIHSRNQADDHDSTKRELAQAKLELARIRKAALTPAPIDVDGLVTEIEHMRSFKCMLPQRVQSQYQQHYSRAIDAINEGRKRT